ncbi:MAG: beta strand repeat-containing protein, partial [Bdellovibrio sp.]
GAAPAAATLTAGAGVSITNSAGGITIAATGSGGTVTNVTGTAPVSVATGTSTPVISLANGSAAGQVYRWDGTSAWAATKLNYTDLINSLAASPWPASSCTAGQAVTWSSASDSFVCSNIVASVSGNTTLANGKIWVGDGGSKAAEVNVSGDATLTNTGALTLANSGATAGTYKSVTVDAKGRVTAGTNPTTLSGYGITDAVANLGGTPGIQTGLDGSKPASPGAGTIYFATDALKIYQYNSSAWSTIASASGAGGTVSTVSVATANGFAGTVATATTTPAITVTTSVNGMAKGNGTALSAATAGTDYSAGTSALATGILKSTTSTGALSIAGSADITTALGYTPVNKAGDSVSGNLTYAANIGDIYTAGSGGNTVKIQGPTGAIGTSYVLRLPTSVAGSNGQVLTSDTSGNLSWTTPSSSTGTVTSASVVSANGFTGTVATATTTPAITITTSVNGMAKGNGTALSAATAGTDYSAGTSALATGLLKSTTSTGALSIAGSADITSALGYTPVNKAGDSMTGALTVGGSVVTTTNPIATGAAVNLATSNIHRLASVGGSAITLSNMVNGGVYTIVVADTTSRTYTFSGCGATYFSPANAATTVSTRTIYGITTIYSGSTWECYVTWASGFQ